MVYCFVHAPNTGGWSGELVLALCKKSGRFRLMDVQNVIREMYPDDDPDSFHYDNNVSAHSLENYLSRKEIGLMQRRSLYGTLEEMHHDEWEKTIKAKYPNMFFLYNPRRKGEA